MRGQHLICVNLFPVQPSSEISCQLQLSASRFPAKAMGEQLIAIEGDVAAQRASLHSFDRTDIFKKPVHLSLSELEKN
jgi:hypothetical protein